MSNRLNQEREQKLQPKRMEYAIAELEKLGKTIIEKDSVKIKFRHNDVVITLFPYSGWWTGKKVGSGRGFKELLKKISA